MDLAMIRKEKNKSQDEVAAAVGMTRAGYSNIELGKRRPSVPMAKKLGAVLGFDWTRLFEDEDPAERDSA